MSTDEQTQRFTQLVDETAKDIKSLNKTNLEVYAKIGQRVASLQASPDNYGNRTVEKFCEQLQQRCGFSLKPSSVCIAARLWNQFGAAGFKDAAAAGMSWRNMTFLSRKSLAPEQAKKLMADAVSGKIPQTKMQDAVRKELGANTRARAAAPKGEKPDDLRQELAVVKRARQVAETLDAAFRELGDAITVICRGDDEERMRVSHATYVDLKEWVDAIQTHWKSATSAADKAYKTVAEIINKE